MTAAQLHDSPPSAWGGSRFSWRLRPVPADGATAPSARAVTRVESSSTTAQDSPRAKIDWLNATFEKPAMTVHGLVRFLDGLMPGRLDATLDGGLFGFTERYRLQLRLDDGAKVEVGAIALGGESQVGKWLLQLNGKGCGMVTDWESVQELLEGLGAAISRVDLAVDFLEGEYSVDDALTLYDTGAFINRGRNPELDTQGSWHESGHKGRTMYVGKLKHGKTLCVYEKGRQLGMPDSDWTRFEVRLGNRDRVIPLSVLTNPDEAFVGAYPALRDLLEAAALEIPTQREETKGTLAHALYHMRRCFGAHAHQAMEATGCTAGDLIEEVRVHRMPRKLDPSGVVAGLAWPELQAQMERLKT